LYLAKSIFQCIKKEPRVYDARYENLPLKVIFFLE